MTSLKVLALDSSSSRLSVALIRDSSTVCEKNIDTMIGHAGIILSVIDAVLSETSTVRDEIGLVAVGTGPGSFTGIRIGLATAKGMATALSCPLAGIPTLDAMVKVALPASMQIMPIVDAKKGEIFCAIYDKNGSRLTDFMNLRPSDIARLVAKDTLLLGNGCELYRDRLKSDLGESYHEAATELWYAKASIIGIMALDSPQNGRPSDVLPIYVRASDATLLLEKIRP